MEQTLDAEYYWLFSVTRWQFQKRVQRNKAEPTDSDYDELKAIAMIESEEQQQVRLSAPATMPFQGISSPDFMRLVSKSFISGILLQIQKL